MNDLALLLVMILGSVAVLWLIGFSLWWMLLIFGVIVYLLLTFMTNRSVQLTGNQIDELKEQLGIFLKDKIEKRRNRNFY